MQVEGSDRARGLAFTPLEQQPHYDNDDYRLPGTVPGTTSSRATATATTKHMRRGSRSSRPVTDANAGSGAVALIPTPLLDALLNEEPLETIREIVLAHPDPAQFGMSAARTGGSPFTSPAYMGPLDAVRLVA